jgi:hypothetical protein
MLNNINAAILHARAVRIYRYKRFKYPRNKVSAKAHTVPFLKFCIEAHFKKEGIRNIMD